MKAPSFSHANPIEHYYNYWLCPEVSSCRRPQGPQGWQRRCWGRELCLDRPSQSSEKGLGQELLQTMEREPGSELISFSRVLQTRLDLSLGRFLIGFISNRKSCTYLINHFILLVLIAIVENVFHPSFYHSMYQLNY